MKCLRLSLVALALPLLTACPAKNPILTGAPRGPGEKIDHQTKETGPVTPIIQEVDTRVDVVFIFDDSESMRNHQERLRRNIHRFVNELAKVSTIDFHIGFTVSHDSGRYGSVVPRVCPDGRVNWEEAGTLKELVGLQGRRYVTRRDNFTEILKASFDPQRIIKPFLPNHKDPNACPSGAEEEELFYPLKQLLTDDRLEQGPNKGFRRKGALFVAILVSDAKDASVIHHGLDASHMYRILERETGSSHTNRRMRVFAVGFPPGFEYGTQTASHRSCKPDPVWKIDGHWPNHRIIGPDDNPLVNLARLTADSDAEAENQILSICDNDYGNALARFGAQIQRDAVSDMIFDLTALPQTNAEPGKELKVMLGNHELVYGQQWKYNQRTNTVTVFGRNIDWSKHQNQRLVVRYTPVKLNSPYLRR